MPISIVRRHFLAVISASLAGGFGNHAFGQSGYPVRPVKLIVPVPPGGVVDVTARQLINFIPPSFGQPIVAENKAGGLFAIGMGAINQAAPDGYTLIHLNAAMLSTQAVTKQFDIFKTLEPIAGLGSTDITISTAGKHAFKSIQELVAHIKANPGKVVWASPGVGTLEHLAMSRIVAQHKLDIIHVPAKNAVEAVQLLVKGEADFGTAPVPFNVQFGSKGMLRALVLLNNRRNPAIPDVPTMQEARFEAPRLTIWGGLAAPKGTPPAVLQQIEAAVAAAMKNPELLRVYRGAGLEPEFETAVQFGQSWKDDWSWISQMAAGPVVR